LSLLSKNDKPWFLNWGKTSCYTHHTFLLGFPTGWSFTTHKDRLSTWHQGARVHPSPYIKRGLQERREQHISTSPSSPGRRPPPTPGCRPPPPTSLSPAWPLEGLRRRRDLTTAACCLAMEFSDPCPMPSTSAILAGSGIPGVIVIVVRVRVRGGVARVVPKSLL
jgi:hypothetical protein